MQNFEMSTSHVVNSDYVRRQNSLKNHESIKIFANKNCWYLISSTKIHYMVWLCISFYSTFAFFYFSIYNLCLVLGICQLILGS